MMFGIDVSKFFLLKTMAAFDFVFIISYPTSLR